MINSLSVQQELGLYARRMCSGIFLCGRDPAEVFLSCSAPRALLSVLKYNVDNARRQVSITYQGVSRNAEFCGDQGSVVLPVDGGGISFTPVAVQSSLPPAEQVEWPIGDVCTAASSASAIRPKLVREAIDLAFSDLRNLTTAVVVVHRGQIIGERYAPGITQQTQLESWSMGKSLGNRKSY